VAIVVPIVSEWNPQGVDRSLADIQRAEGGWAKAGVAIEKAAVPAGIALGALAVAGGKAIAAAEEAAAANAKLSQVYSSMGYEENTQAALDYADALSKQIGVDDEVIKGAQTKLATFSEVAKSTETMARATSLAADLSAAGFGSMESASVMLGKAIQDPIKGLTAMTRVGVTFTKQQEEQITALVESGKAAEAQGIILDAVATQVGGVAEASATSSAKLGVAFGEISESVGTALLPAMEAVMPYFMDFATWAQENGSLLAGIGAVIAGLASVILVLAGALKALAIIKSVIALIKGLNLALLSSPWFWVIAAVVLLAVIIWKNWDKIKTWTAAVWGWLKGFLVSTWESLKSAVATAFEWIVDKVEWAWDLLKTLFRLTPIGIIVTHLDEIQDAFEEAFDWIVDKATWLWEQLTGIFDKIGEGFSKVGDVIGAVNPFSGGGEGGGTLPSVVPVSRSLEGGVPYALGAGTYAVSRPSAASGVTVNVYGAVDPEGTARTIKRILDSHDVRQGRVAGQPQAVAW
jgi:hypothetical protein